MLTQKDIARRLGVSQALVSRALTGTAQHVGAAPATIQRICQAAIQLNYLPNSAARTLRGAPTRTLGVVVKDFDDPFFGHLIGALQDLACRQDYSLIITGATETGRRDALAGLLKHQVDGLVIVGSDFRPPGLQPFLRQKLPTVILGTGDPVPGAYRVSMDEKYGLQEMVRYLHRLGHRQIGLLSNHTLPNQRRQNFVKQFLQELGLPKQSLWFVSLPRPASEAGYQGMKHLLQGGRHRRPTAVIAMEDVMAQAALRALFEAGLQSPRDISITGIDDIPAAAMTIPALTTIRQPIRKMVQTAFDLLIQPSTRHFTQKEHCCLVIQPELIPRESCGRPNA